MKKKITKVAKDVTKNIDLDINVDVKDKLKKAAKVAKELHPEVRHEKEEKAVEKELTGTIDDYLNIKITGAADKELLEKQYEKLMEFIMQTDANRTSLNSFHQTIAAAVVGVMSGIYSFNIAENSKFSIVAIISTVGLIMCYTWINELKRFHKSAQILDKIVERIESHLPANPLDARSKLLATIDAPARTEKQEQTIPKALAVIYSVLIVTMFVLILR